MQDHELRKLAEEVGQALAKRRWRLATAESCTGGWIAKTATDIAGSSDWFEGGVVSYSNDLKTRLLDVPAQVIETHGAVSEPVVLAMARGAAALTGSQSAISVSGVAGPGGGTPSKPVGLVWFGFWVDGECLSAERHFEGDREAVRRQSVAFGLHHLLGHI